MTSMRSYPGGFALRLLPLAAISAILLIAGPAVAQYKVVSPDGHVTYTDTPPPASSGAKVTKLHDNISVIAQATLPLELRTAMSKYPVTLYAMKVCEPCDAARNLLRHRGIPFTEKLIVTGDDGEALQRLSGARDTPTLTIGSQVLRGLAADTWTSYLDNAGYPQDSRLPANYQYPPAQPLTEPPPKPATVAEQQRAARQQQEPKPAEQQTPGGIRF
jgi:glutaredoxin